MAVTSLNSASISGRGSFLETMTYKNILGNLNNTLIAGFTVGLIGIIGFSFNVKRPLEILFLMVLVAAAAYVCGFFLGFLFGIPKRNVEKESAYNLSTNLVDISDWLTKIIIGLGLIEIKKIPSALQAIGLYIQSKTGANDSVSIFSACCIVYFSVFGLYYGYNYMRLFLSGQFKEADDNLLMNQQKLSETKEELKNFDLSPDNVNEEAKEKVNVYNELLKSTKTEENYTFDDWYIKGVDAYNRQDYNSTISNMNRAIEKDRNNKRIADAYLYIGLSFYYLKSYDNARMAYNKIIDEITTYPFLYVAYVNRGLCYSALGMLDLALKDYEKAISLEPDYENAWAAKADAFMDLNQTDDAIAAYTKAISLDPNDASALLNRGVCYARKEDKENALNDLKKAILLKPDYKSIVIQNKDVSSIFTSEEIKNITG